MSGPRPTRFPRRGSPRGRAGSLAGMHRMLRLGGRLLLDTGTVAESLLVGGIKPRAVHEFGGIRVT